MADTWGKYLVEVLVYQARKLVHQLVSGLVSLLAEELSYQASKLAHKTVLLMVTALEKMLEEELGILEHTLAQKWVIQSDDTRVTT